ncbi:MAG: hypothetical protein GDA53_06695 [Rhodobacteraceae bacterium]|nr:hypothetical protein [Paracoccaceae bacterium]
MKRLYPVRFRHLSGKSSFNRWDWVNFKYRPPTRDRRQESCHVMEETIRVSGKMPARDRASFLNPLVSASIKDAEDAGKSLALIRPRNTRFYYKAKTSEQVEAERETCRKAARQGEFFDEELKALEPGPYTFRFKFEDGTGPHDYANGDREAHAMFFNGKRREGSDEAALKWMCKTFNEEHPQKGMLFCVGNMAKRPQTWQLLGILRVDDTGQGALFPPNPAEGAQATASRDQ